MICVFRTQYSHFPGEYRPMSVCWSNDLGKTWTKPVPTKPHLMNIAPKLIVLENDVIALEYGRPGFHVAFSIDNGHTWQNRVSLSHLPVEKITGQFDMAKAGPNKLVAKQDNGTAMRRLSKHQHTLDAGGGRSLLSSRHCVPGSVEGSTSVS